MPEDDVPELSERFLGGMALAQTPRQQEAAGEIYRELAAGKEVEDIKPLIERMMSIVVEERNKHRPEAAEPPAREPRREWNDQWSEHDA
ncbi:MAG TPA: hypothetical protein VJ914_23700 [Pseudonocardiaceae bacterium]|nr:hypothetical protein [Pseudonocardiaceae bacterium]